MSFKRVLALVLALTMIFSLAMPGSWAFAEEDDGIVAVEDGYNEEGIVEDPVEEEPTITEETPAEEPAAEVIVPDDEPAEEPEETEEEEEELEELLLEDLDTFEAINPDDVAKVGKNGYASVQAAVTFLQDNGIEQPILLLANSDDPITISGGVNITIRPNDGETSGNTIGVVTVSAGAEDTVSLARLTVEKLTLGTADAANNAAVELSNVTVNSNVEINGGKLTYNSGEVKGTVNVNGGSFIVPETTEGMTAPTFDKVEASAAAAKRTVMGGNFGTIPSSLIAFKFKNNGGTIVRDTDNADKLLATEAANGTLKYYGGFNEIPENEKSLPIYLFGEAEYELPDGKTITVFEVDEGADFTCKNSGNDWYYIATDSDLHRYTSTPFFGGIVSLSNPEHPTPVFPDPFVVSFGQGAARVATGTSLGLLVNPDFPADYFPAQEIYNLPDGKSIVVGVVAETSDQAETLFNSKVRTLVNVSDSSTHFIESDKYTTEKFNVDEDTIAYAYIIKSTPIVAKIGNTPYASLSDAVKARGTNTDLEIVLYRAGEYKLSASDVLKIKKNSGDLELTLKSSQPYLYVTPKVATTTELETYKLEMYHAKIGSNWYETLSDAAKAYTKDGDPIFVLTNCKLDTAENSKDKIELTADLPIIKINENGHEEDVTVFTNATGKAIKVSGPDSNNITTYELVEAKAYINTNDPAHSYPTLEDAIKVASSTDVVYLATDTKLTNTAQWDGDAKTGIYNIDKAVTINGNGHTISIDSFQDENHKGHVFNITTTEAVKLQNLVIDGVEQNARAGVHAYTGANVTLDNVTVKNCVVGVIVNASTVEATNLKTSGNAWGGVNVDAKETRATFSISSGILEEDASIWTENGKQETPVVVNITGGSFKNVGADGDNASAPGYEGFKISGGTFAMELPVSFCADGFEPSFISEGVYGVNPKTVVAYEVYATDTTLLMSYVATQSELAIAEVKEANGSKYLKTEATIELATGTSIYVATDTNVISDETNELVKTFYPKGSTEANAQYMNVWARAYIAELLDADGVRVKYVPAPTAWEDAVREANEASGTLKFLQTVRREVEYTMATATDADGNYKSLTLTAADGVDYSNVDIKAPEGYQLHKSEEGDTYTIGKAIAVVTYDENTYYFDNIPDAAKVAVEKNVVLEMLATPTDVHGTYSLATGTELRVVGFDIQDNLDSGNNALIVTPGEEDYDFSYTVEATVASVNDVNYRSFKEAVAVATKTDATVVLVKKPADNDKISLTAEDKDYELTVQDNGLATPSDLFTIPTKEVYFDTADAADGATTYTLQRYAAVLTDGTGAPTYYKAGELNNAIDEYYKNPTHYAFVELLDDGSYTMAQTAKKLPVKSNDYKFTATPTDANAFKIEVEEGTIAETSVKIYSVAVYVARVDWTKFESRKTVEQGKYGWTQVETGKYLAKTLSEAVATATSLATKTDVPSEAGKIGFEYTITLLATGTDYVMDDGTTLKLEKNGFTTEISTKTPTEYELIEDPDGTYTSYKKYAITYNSNLDPASYTNLNPAYYTTATNTVLLKNAEKTGYTFAGWYSDEEFATQVTSINTSDKAPKTLYAKFDAKTFTVEFDANSTDATGTMTDLTLTFGDETKSLPAMSFVRTGYSFNGWSLSADGAKWAVDKNPLNADAVNELYAKATETDLKVTLYALWKPFTFTVEFNANGGSGTMSNQTFTYGTDTTLTLNTFNSGSGYTGFEGWNTAADGSGTSYADGAAVGTISVEDGATVTLYAQWGAAKFTLHFDGQGATSGTMEDISLTYNLASPTQLPANTFKKDGNEFQGWAYNGTKWAVDSNTLDVAAINDLFAKATGTDLTVTLSAMWQPKNAQVGEKFYDSFVEAVTAARTANDTLILWATPTDFVSVERATLDGGPFVVSVKDMRSSAAADVNGDLLVIKNDTGRNDASVYFAETEPEDGVITYTLTKYAARLTDGQGTPKYYTDFDGTDETTAAVAAYLKHPGYYKYIEILDNVQYTMAYDTWAKDGLYLPVKATYGSLNPTAEDDTYSINTLTAAERTAAGIAKDATDAYAVGLNTVTVQFHHVKLVNSQTQGQKDWVDDTSAVPVAEYTRNYDSLEKAVAAIRAARTGLNKNTQKVLVTITVSADDTLVLTTANEEYTITFENGASADVTIAKKLEATCVLTTTGEGQTFTYKAFVVNGTDVKFVNQTDADAELISTYKATAGTKIINPGDPMNPIDSSIDKYEYKGYYFDKWYKDAEMTEEFDFNAETVPAEGSLTVYGRFLKATYTLTLDFAGGTAPADWTLGNAIEYSIDSNNFTLPALTNGDYTFERWDGVAADGEKWSTKTAEYVWTPVNNPKNWKLTAVWSGATVKVDFVDSVTQTLIAPQVTQEEGAALVVPTLADVNEKIPVENYPEGKTLVADRLWQGVDADTVASKDVTVYNLNWLDLYEVNFHANGIDFGSAEVPDGDKIPEYSIPTIRMTGKTAVWHIGSEDGEVFDILNDVVTGNLDLYATFADQVKVTFLADDGLYIEKLIVSGETVEQPADPEPAEGFDFVGWYLGDAKEAFDFETPITENTTLTAKFAMNADYFKGIVYTASAQLAESINLNLKMANVPAGTSAKDYYVKVSVNGNETENTFEQNGDATHLKAIAERAYAFQMNDVVDMSVYYVGLEEPIKVITGYSLRQYFENRYRAANTSNNEKAMFKAALDYGAAAQLNFNYDVENLANSTVNPENALPTVEKPNSKASREGTIDGITSYKVSLVMDSQVAVKFKVNAANKDDYTFNVDGYDFKVSDAPVNGYYEIDVTGFTPLNLKNNVTLTITKGSELVKLSYSPYTYAANKWASTENNGALANLVKAMVIFGNAVATWNDNPTG